jgi:hypothetical protein
VLSAWQLLGIGLGNTRNDAQEKAAEAHLFLDGVVRKDSRRRRTNENYSLFWGGRLARIEWSWRHEDFG